MQNETIVALSTPQGEGAIAVIRLSGPESIATVNHYFSKNLAKAHSREAIFGRILENEDIIDEVVVTVFKNPNSYTGEDVVEISCHASSYIVDTLLALLSRGAVCLAEPGEFTQRAYLNGKLNLSQAEAVADLIASESKAAHRMTISQMRGGYSKELSSLRGRLGAHPERLHAPHSRQAPRK